MALAMLMVLIVALAISWAVTTGIIWLICLCFGWTFSLLIATGVWLILTLIASVFKD